MKRIEAYAWLSYEDSDAKKPKLVEFGNGSEYQYPIFGSRKEAMSWKENNCGSPGLLARLVKVEVRL